MSFKADIIGKVDDADRYKGQGNVDLVTLDHLDRLTCDDYDAILVMDSVRAWSLFNFSLKSFLEKTQDCGNGAALYCGQSKLEIPVS
ncbi:MAG: hypothetical protein R2860_09615 [Desulfobacterales bacterium]